MSSRLLHRGARSLGATLLLAVTLGAASGMDPGEALIAAPSPAPAGTASGLASRTSARWTAAAAAARGEGIRLESRTTFTLDPAGPAVHVVYEATVTNEAAPVYGPFSVAHSYLPELAVPVVKEAVAVAASRGDGSPLPTTVEDLGNPVVAAAVVDLVPDLEYQDVQTIRLTYDIPPVAARTPGISRVNPAFATFPVFALGDPGLASVEVIVPDAYEVELVGSDMEEAEREGTQVFSASAIDDPLTFDVSVVARDDDQLVARPVELGDHDATVLGWPGDDAWTDFVADHLGRGIPLMSDLIGLPWPLEEELEVVETVSPYLYGYAGWFQPLAALIEIGDELDGQVVLHELSHAWFNHDLFETRWVNEALAEVYAARTLADLGGTAPTPRPTTAADPGALPLNEWSRPSLQADLSFEQEAYGYDTSWALLQRVVDEIGLERLGEVVRAADAGLLPYGLPDLRADHPGTHTWRQLLDLLTDLGGSELAEPLFRERVVSADQVADLDARVNARVAYAQLVADSGGWRPPVQVREAMARWDFDVAQSHVATVRDLLPLRQRVLDGLAGLGLEPSTRLRGLWEQADTTAELGPVMRRVSAVLDGYVATRARVDRTDGLVAAVGLAFIDVDGMLDRAHAHLAAGRIAEAAAALADVDRALDDAATSAAARTVALLAILGASLGIVRSGLRPPPDWPSRLGPHHIGPEPRRRP